MEDWQCLLFDNRDDLLSTVKDFYKRQGFLLVIAKSSDGKLAVKAT